MSITWNRSALFGFSLWFGRNKTKTISFSIYPRHFFVFHCGTNGAVKGVDKCLDWNLIFCGLFFSYTDWDYSK